MPDYGVRTARFVQNVIATHAIVTCIGRTWLKTRSDPTHTSLQYLAKQLGLLVLFYM